MTALFLSDVHLLDATSVKSKLVIRFLQEQASRFDSIYIMGDFFDVWPATTNFLVKRFEPILSVLRELVENGHEVHYFEGNHDFHLGEYFTKNLGIRVYANSQSVVFGSKRVYLAHGDLGNPKDLVYRALRSVLRNGIIKKVIGKIPSKLVYYVGEKSSRFSRDYQTQVGRNDAVVRKIYRESAKKIFQSGYDIVLMGHTHIPDDYTVKVHGKDCRYINTGDWVRHFSYVEFDGQDFYTRTHPVKSL